jgi:hypothetical protein
METAHRSKGEHKKTLPQMQRKKKKKEKEIEPQRDKRGKTHIT